MRKYAIKNPFTIDDVKKWLGCSREAGTVVWINSQFFQAMVKTIQKSVLKKEYIAIIGTYKDIENIAYDTVTSVHMEMKQKAKELNFENIYAFIGYVKKTIPFRIKDHIKKILNDTSNTNSLESINDDENTSTMDIPDETSIDKQQEVNDIQKIADDCLNDFENSNQLQSTKGLLNRLRLLRKISGDRGAIGVIAFLLVNEGLTDFRENAKKINQYDKDVWSSYNRRLKNSLGNFFETQRGRKHFLNLKEFYYE